MTRKEILRYKKLQQIALEHFIQIVDSRYGHKADYDFIYRSANTMLESELQEAENEA